VKERPILFSGAMVRALLAGTKTQTRRVVNPQPRILAGELLCWNDDALTDDQMAARCPYGQPGDRLWVREAWRTADTLDSMSPSAIADKCLDAGYRKPWAPLQWESDGSKNKDWSGFGPGNGVVVGLGKLRPGIHMPRWASRITLDVTGVRVERLQDISDADAVAEGCAQNHNGYFWGGPHEVSGLKQMATARQAYRDLWESINGPESWAANPWVWVVEFKRSEVLR